MIVATTFRPFDIRLRGSATFLPVSPVVFVPLVQGIAECEQLEVKVRSGPLARDVQYTYHPHVTVAHDLPDDALYNAWTALSSYDAVLTPTLAVPPLPIGAIRNDENPAEDFEAQKRFTPYTSMWNVTGSPAVSLPTHWTPDGLPVGVMLATAPGEEALLVSLAAQVEAAAPWADRKPPVW